VNIFYINGDEVGKSLEYIGTNLPDGAHNIIYPAWELSSYPEEWARQLDRFDEIWAQSKFTEKSIAGAVSKPVIHMPLPCEVKVSSFLGRRYFGIIENAYVFLFYFDFTSHIERKNPFAVLEAFERLCTKLPDRDCRLVIKMTHSNQMVEDFQRFMSVLSSNQFRERITVIDRILSDNEVKNLVRCSDCFISLHRSEGFGRGLTEAMYMGKPVIGTGYSGNMDFMTKENSCLVQFELNPVEDGAYPHAEDQEWAEPDIDHAVQYMKMLVEDPDYGRMLGRRASRDIRTYFGYRAVGIRYISRIMELGSERSLKFITGRSHSTHPEGGQHRKKDSIPDGPSQFVNYDEILSQIEFRILDASPDEVPQIFKDVPLDIFGQLTLQEQDQYPNIREFLPSMPTEEIQLNWTGASGETLLKQSIAFVESVVEYTKSEMNVEYLSNLKLLDFGSGWGRLLRLFYKYVPTFNLYAVDAWETSLEHYKQSNLKGEILQINEICEEIPFETNFDLIISFSVFTHLSRRSSQAAINAMRRSINDDGLLILTVRPKEFIPFFLAQNEIVASAKELDKRYEDEGFVFFPHNREPFDDDITYGDTFISVDYIEKNWRGWRILESRVNPIDPYQKLIVLKPK
jgi:glycosyltransferase involved in cell wall biosynthesis